MAASAFALDLEAILTARTRSVADVTESIAGSALTLREREVLAVLTTGAGNGEIAATLMISPDTVKTHVKHLLEKARARNRTELVGMALSEKARTATPAESPLLDGELMSALIDACASLAQLSALIAQHLPVDVMTEDADAC